MTTRHDEQKRANDSPHDSELGGWSTAIAAIARQYLQIETLETRQQDSLDFHDVAVWKVRGALEAAFRAGALAERAKQHRGE